MKLYISPDVSLADLDEIASDLGFAVDGAREVESTRVRGIYKGKHVIRFVLRPTAADKIDGGRSKRFQMVRSDSYRATERNPGGHKCVHAVCWHGHYHFMRRVFALDEGATFDTGMDTWAGLSDFLTRAPNSGARNIGSMIEPLRYDAACECHLFGGDVIGDPVPAEHRIEFGKGELRDGELVVVETRLIRQSDVQRCPHFILLGEHYREDGTCRCNDPEATEMVGWGYTWKDGQWR
jgi:hypothetical protein